jgi:Apolipoprotein A1/A4/E domain
MANNPKKIVDPTEAALSAIQEALKVRDDEDQPELRAPSTPEPTETDDVWAGAPPSPSLFDADPTAAPGSDSRAYSAANDDQQSIGQVLRALQNRPARTSYFVAAAFSAAWIVGCVGLSWAYLGDVNAALGAGHSPAATLIGFAAAALLPIIFFFGLAHMAWRAQELRLIAQSMAKVAMRLAEPEGVARDSIVTVGQAIRREVAAMGDGVERALARASELESLVRNEVAALERTYSDNEVRIRGLLQDLSNQRDTLVGQAEQVRSAINNVHIDLTQDLSTISDLVGQQVNEAAERITNSLAEKGENITLTLGQIGDNMIQQLSVRGEDLIVRLENASEETSRALAIASDQLTTSLNFKTDHIGEEFSEIARGLEDMMTSRLDGVTDGFSEKSLAVVDMMVGRSQELTDAIVNTSSQLAETIATRADEVNSTLKASGESIILDLNLRGGDVAKKLEAAGARVAETLIARSTKMTDTVRESADHVADVVAARGEEVTQLIATRLAAFEEMFDHSGAELGEKISRDSSMLGNLITRHLAEFDRTVKTYGSELVERLGARTQDVSESMRGYVDTFDSRVTAKATEVTTGLDQRLANFQEALDTRTQTLSEALATRIMDIAKTLSEGGREVVTAVDKRISDVTTVINSGGLKLAETIGERGAEVATLIDTRGAMLTTTIGQRAAEIDKTLGAQALRVAETLDSRIGHLEHLLVGRAEAVTQQIEVRSRAAADLLNARLAELSESIKTNSGNAEQALGQLATRTVEALGKTAATSAAATEALNRSAAEATVSLNRSATALSNTIANSAAAAGEAIDKTTASAGVLMARSAATTTEALNRSATALSSTIANSAAAAGEAIDKTTASAGVLMARSAATTTEAIGRTTSEAERVLTDMSARVARTASEAESALTGLSAEVARNVSGRTEEITATVSQRVGEMTRLLDEKSNGLVAAISGKGEEMAGEVSRITDQAVKSIEAKSFVFTQTMMDNSEEIARLINDASHNATGAMTRTLGQLQEGVLGVSEGAKATLTRTLDDLHRSTRSAIEESKQTASATVADMLETHGMLRSDTTALFERLREANILLQEVLSGAHENMSSLERTMVIRVSEFVSSMNDLAAKSDASAGVIEQHVSTFNAATGRALRELTDLAAQFNGHGRSLAEAVELLEKSNRRTDESIANKRANIEALVATLDARTDDFGQRLQRFSSLLDESLDAATTRAREIAGVVAETSNDSVHTIERQFELVRTTSEEERRRTSEALTAVYDQAAGQAHTMFRQSADRFTEVMQGMKQMATEMQQELETTRTELRRGIFELPQETADSAAQMRRVIVDQIEALAELNRIVARHGRSFDTAEPMRSEPARREPEPAYASGGGGGRPPARATTRGDITAAPPAPMRGDITGAPPRRPEQPGQTQNGNGRNGGWLGDLLARASREDSPPIAPVPRDGARGEERPQREAVESLDSLAVDVARMIDHEAAADLWERYKRGERGLFTRRLYTTQGQKAFDEIRGKYRADPEFRQTVEQYIHEFERLLDDVSRGDRGPSVVRNYLTSDTGKVYTMLAHAAGRFDQ